MTLAGLWQGSVRTSIFSKSRSFSCGGWAWKSDLPEVSFNARAASGMADGFCWRRGAVALRLALVPVLLRRVPWSATSFAIGFGRTLHATTTG